MGTNVGTDIKLWIFKAALAVYDVITFPIYFIVQRPWRAWRYSRLVWAKPLHEEDPYSPVVKIVTALNNPLEGVNTMDQLFHKAVARHGQKRCFGYREVLGEEEELVSNGKVFKKFRLGDYHWLTYQEADKKVDHISCGLLALGVQPRRQILIFAETRLEWMLAAQACFRINVPVATLYATLGEDGIVHGINETEVSLIITSHDLIPKLKKMIHLIPAINTIVYMEGLTTPSLEGFPEHVNILPFSHLESLGNTCDPGTRPEGPGPNDLAILMYTSGSTGIPKGVMMTHKNCVVTTSGLYDAIPKLRSDDLYIAYLPLAHVLEISAECYFFIHGVPVGYSSPFTLTDKSTAVMSGCRGDATLLKPTIMTAVPLMLDRIRKSVMEVAASKGPFAKALFQYAVKYKHFWWKLGFNAPILNRLVFRRIQQLVGGHVRVIACGGAPLSPDTHDFVRACLNIHLIQAYGMTETAASATLMSLEDRSTGRVGPPLSSCYIRLVDWKEGSYHATDKPYPRGEVVIGGDCVTLGYFKNEALTRESFTQEGDIRWFYTADIGELYPDGTFKIIDRKKDLVKLQFGEYVSLGKVEAELKTSPLVDNICTFGNGFHNYLVAVMVPNQQQLDVLARELGKEGLPFSELCEDEAVVAAVTRSIAAHGLKCRLQKTEIPARVKLCTEEWLPDTGLVTAAFKLRRKMIQQFYQRAIDEMYAEDSNGSTSKST